MKKLLLILLCLPLLFSCDGGMKEKLPDGDTDIFLYETYEYAEVFQGLESANTYLRETAEVTAIDEEVINEKTTETTEGVTDLLAEIEADASSFEEFASENPLYAVLYPNVDQQNQLNPGPVVGFCAVKDTAALNVYLKDDAIRKFFPVDVKFAYTVKPYDPDGKFVQLVALKSNRAGEAAMEGYDIIDASQEFSQYTAFPEISISLSQDGAKEWKKLTAKNIGRSIAIVVDGFVYSYPTVQIEIIGGRFTISGNWSLNESKELVKKIHKRKAHF